MLHDHRGLAVSTDSSAALEHFETALAQFHAYRGDPIATLDQALAADESFVLAHLAKAFMAATAGEGRVVPLARSAVARAEELSGQANAVDASGETPEITLPAFISARPQLTQVDDNGNVVPFNGSTDESGK